MSGFPNEESATGTKNGPAQFGVFARKSSAEKLLPPWLLKSLASIHREFEGSRQELLARRAERQREFDAGALPGFESGHPALQETWSVAPIPRDIMKRRVEITGPASSAKMVVNMLNGVGDGVIADMAMLDFEDSLCPTWSNVIDGIANVKAVAEGNLEFEARAADGKSSKIYRLDTTRMAHPMVRVRGLHLQESNILVDGVPISAGIFDAFCAACHYARPMAAQGRTPLFYVPKCEHYLEARWWNRLLSRIEAEVDLPPASIRTTFLIETLPAAFQMEEILYEIRERACGLNGGRWDKIFSDIKVLRNHPDRVLAERSYIDMSRPWMDSYVKLLIKTCHAHGAHAMGGMSAFTPGKDAEMRRMQTEKVVADKRHEASIGHDGCWVSHPYFVSHALAQFPREHQLDRQLADFPRHPDLLPVSEGPKTLAGLRKNVRVGIAYLQGWNEGLGCVAFDNLMEDLATLEISRAQVWQWLRHGAILNEGALVSPDLVRRIFHDECRRIMDEIAEETSADEVSLARIREKWAQAAMDAERLFLSENLSDFFATASPAAET